MPTGHSLADTPTPLLQRFILAVLPVVIVAFLGNLATIPNIPTWYASLAKPPFTPPNWVFGPAWTILYALMAFSLWRILSLPRSEPGRAGAIATFFVQLALNALWSWAFFAGHSPLAGLIVIVALIAAIVITIYRFKPLDPLAALFLVPYLAWVIFASALNLAIWELN
ncbi:TspO/MBR family protein [Microvirga flavescens]|uniref:TspO/MBR family protein n=1 Tax=Microvirga flavescens TaxID=2249811 RepID=UPI000DD68F7B|nr:TspO/MBR family protein [Microvirga flavescens]